MIQTVSIPERWPYQDWLKGQSLLSHRQVDSIAATSVERANRAGRERPSAPVTSLAAEIAEKPA